jgi:outer membrane protein
MLHFRPTGILVIFSLTALPFYAQQAPASPDKPWPVPRDARFRMEETATLASGRPPVSPIDPEHAYTLAELVDIAERNNPETRVLWEQAKQKAAEKGVARSALFPTVAALASASLSQYSFFMGKFYREDLATFPATLSLTYTVFDFGGRSAKLDQAKASLLAADFGFNDTHRRIVFEVAEAHYRLLDAMAQEDAARATLNDTQTVQQATETKLANGLATLPDVLEARAATAQAQYELASIEGLEAIARGSLATLLGVSPIAMLHVEDSSKTVAAETLEEPVQAVLARALAQRPDLLAQIAQVRFADGEIKQARSAYYPVLSFSGEWGHRNSYGSQNFSPTVSSHIYPYSVQLNFNWTIFDGGAHHSEVMRAEADRREAEARAVSSRDQIENEVWTSYANFTTAQAQQKAANALLDAAQLSFNAATRAFQAGVRTFVDVTAAQRQLARARTAQASARIQVLTSLADLAFRAADPIGAAGH